MALSRYQKNQAKSTHYPNLPHPPLPLCPLGRTKPSPAVLPRLRVISWHLVLQARASPSSSPECCHCHTQEAHATPQTGWAPLLCSSDIQRQVDFMLFHLPKRRLNLGLIRAQRSALVKSLQTHSKMHTYTCAASLCYCLDMCAV